MYDDEISSKKICSRKVDLKSSYIIFVGKEDYEMLELSQRSRDDEEARR